MPDSDLLQVLDALEIVVLADCLQVLVGATARLGVQFGHSATDTPEIEVAQTVEMAFFLLSAHSAA